MQCPELSRTQAQKLIEDGHITVNGQAVKSSLKLQPGDQVDIVIPPPIPSPLTPEAIPLKILYEDKDLMVVDKPAGLTVHPAPGHYTHTLVNAVLAHVPDIEGGEVNRPGIVHRLDKDTSGLIIIAKNSTAHMKLAEQFKSRSVTKVYQALVQGHLTPEQGTIEAGIGRDPRDRKRMAVVTRGREARTEYKVIKYSDNFTLLEVRPKTGRTHQIRVHLAAIGFPVVGDATYGAKSEYLSRQFLHACKLGFRLPSSGEYREFESELPPDLVKALKEISNIKFFLK
jgi:23S rRNA pseudouridine1911/1915/1917 synthase